DRRRMASEVPRASHPFVPGSGPARPGRARRRSRAELRRNRGPPDGGRDGSPRRRRARSSRRPPSLPAEKALHAAAALEEVENLFDAATARLLAGQALAQAGERDRAAAELERAATAFESFGSYRYQLHAERELRKLGRSIHRRTRPGKEDGSAIDTLTERELH